MTHEEFPAGPDQTIVVYDSDDTGEEIDPFEVFAAIATDAATRAAAGWRIVSTAELPTRHSQGFLARAGSGYTTKMAVAVVYARAAAV